MLTQVGAAMFRIAVVVLPVWLALRLGRRMLARGAPTAPSRTREGVLLAALLYAIVLAAITVYPLPAVRHRNPSLPGINALPLAASLRCMRPAPTGPPEARRFCLENIAGNIALFVPVGVLVPLLSRRRASLSRVLLIALTFSVVIETTQFVERKLGLFRSVDIDDVLFNVAGAAVGYLVWVLVVPLVCRPSTTQVSTTTG